MTITVKIPYDDANPTRVVEFDGPSWSGLLPIFVEALTSDEPTRVKWAAEMLVDMAKAADSPRER